LAIRSNFCNIKLSHVCAIIVPSGRRKITQITLQKKNGFLDVGIYLDLLLNILDVV